jgi:hypothetical protein
MRFSPEKHKLFEEARKQYRNAPLDASFMEKYNRETVHFQETFAYYIQVNSWATPVIFKNFLLTFLCTKQPKIYATMISLDGIIRALSTTFPAILASPFRGKGSEVLLKNKMFKAYPLDEVAEAVAYVFFQEFSNSDVSRKYKLLYELAKAAEKVGESSWENLVSFIEAFFLNEGLRLSLESLPRRLCDFWFKVRETFQEGEKKYLIDTMYGFLNEFDESLLPIRFRVKAEALEDPKKFVKEEREINICLIGFLKKERPNIFFKDIFLQDLQALLKDLGENSAEIEELLMGIRSWYKIKKRVFKKCNCSYCIKKRLNDCPLKENIYEEIRKAWTR